MDRKIAWILTNGLWLACVIAATFYGIQGAYYVTVFIVGLTVFTGCLSVFFPEAATPGYTFGKFIEHGYDLIITCFFIFAGMFWLAGLYYTFNLIQYAAKEKNT